MGEVNLEASKMQENISNTPPPRSRQAKTVRAAERLAGARGPYFKIFSGKIFFGEQSPLNLSYQFLVLSPKKQISCPLRGNI